MTDHHDSAELGLVASLARAQQEIQNAPLNKTNPHFKSKYADLAAIRDQVVPVLSRFGIAVIQVIAERGEFGFSVVTKLLKGSEELTSECPIMVGDRVTPQAFGSAMTYAKRYGLASLVCISAEEDDDGNAAQQNTRKGDIQSRAKRKAQQAPSILPQQTSLPAISVPMTADNTPDWVGFFDAFMAALQAVTANEEIDNLVKGCAAPFANLKAEDENLFKILGEKVINKREALKNEQS